MRNYIKVRDFDGEFHPWVANLDNKKVKINPTKLYELVATCSTTGISVILDSDSETLLSIQSIDCEYVKG